MSHYCVEHGVGIEVGGECPMCVRKERDRLFDALHRVATRERATEIERDELRSEVERLRGALEQYADAENWCEGHNSGADVWKPTSNGWEPARAVLATKGTEAK